MKKENRLWIAALLLAAIIISGCSSTKEKAKDITESLTEHVADIPKVIINKTIEQLPEEPHQVVIPPGELPESLGQSQSSGDTTSLISKNYILPCSVRKYSVLHYYCGVKTYWNKQSTLLSWYIPYWLVLLITVMLIFFVIWYLWQRGRA